MTIDDSGWLPMVAALTDQGGNTDDNKSQDDECDC
jgi:hypothetical protein